MILKASCTQKPFNNFEYGKYEVLPEWAHSWLNTKWFAFAAVVLCLHRREFDYNKFIQVVFKMLISKIPICMRRLVLRITFSSSVCNCVCIFASYAPYTSPTKRLLWMELK